MSEFQPTVCCGKERADEICPSCKCEIPENRDPVQRQIMWLLKQRDVLAKKRDGGSTRPIGHNRWGPPSDFDPVSVQRSKLERVRLESEKIDGDLEHKRKATDARLAAYDAGIEALIRARAICSALADREQANSIIECVLAYGRALRPDLPKKPEAVLQCGRKIWDIDSDLEMRETSASEYRSRQAMFQALPETLLKMEGTYHAYVVRWLFAADCAALLQTDCHLNRRPRSGDDVHWFDPDSEIGWSSCQVVRKCVLGNKPTIVLDHFELRELPLDDAIKYLPRWGIWIPDWNVMATSRNWDPRHLAGIEQQFLQTKAKPK